jgi:putative isomerase
MYQIPCNKYWNTWSSKSPAIMEFLPAEFYISIGANSYAENGKYTNFPFTQKIKLFEHHPDGNYCRLQVEHGGTVLQIEYIKSDDYTVTGKVKAVKFGEWGLRFQTLISFGFEKEGIVEKRDGSFYACERSYEIAVALKDKPIRDCYVDSRDALGKAVEELGYYTPMPETQEKKWYSTMYNLEETPEIIFSVSVSNDFEASRNKAEKAIDLDFDELKQKHMSSLSNLVKGKNISAMESMREVMAWNTIADHKNHRVFTSLTRFWIDRKFGGWFIWLDDILMHGLINAFAGDWTMARNCIKSAMDNTTPQGNLACLMSEFTEWVDRSQPPITSFIIYKYYQLTGDRQLLEEIYPVLLKANLWWYEHRDGNGNGVLEYGSSQVGKGHFNGTKLAAKDEAAMDNSPMYDSARFIKETNTINMEDIALNSLLVLDGECLHNIAKIVGDNENAELVLKKSRELKLKIDENLWDEERGIYANKHWEEGFVCPSPTSFYPLAAGVPEGERVERLISHIFNEDEFWTELPLPSIWIKEESVNDNVYWRGRSWPPLNFFTYVGLKRYRKYAEASKLLNQIMKHYTKLWEEERACYENHNTFTGEGKDSVDTDPYYGWGALYPLMWILEHIDMDPWNGFHFGSPEGNDFEIEGLKMHDGIYSLNCSSEGTALIKNGLEIVRTDAVGRFTDFEWDGCYMVVNVPKQNKDCTIKLGQSTPIKVLVNGEEKELSNRIKLEKGKVSKIEIYMKK